MRGPPLLACLAAFLVLSCAPASPSVAAPTTEAPVATSSASPQPASSTNSHDEVRAEIRRREDADTDLFARGYGERHPARLVLRAELESLRASDNAWSPNGGPREARLAVLRASEAGLLAAGRGENHPDVVSVRAKIRDAETSR